MAKIKCEHGYAGKIAKVDLSTKEITYRDTALYAPDFIGSRGMAEKVFWDEGDFEAGPFDPSAVVVMMTSPLAGTLAGAANQMCIFGRSTTLPNPQLRASMCGSGFGAELKRCGLDGIIITGASAEPVYLLANDEGLSIKPAEVGALWGLDAWDTRTELWRRYGDRACVLAIGPGGENMCRGGIIATDDCHSFANGGFGAVWGSKKLKAVVALGTGDITVAHPDKLIADAKRATDLMVQPPYNEGLHNSNRRINYYADFHFATPEPDFKLRERTGEIKLGWTACLNCPLACGMTHRYTDGSGAGTSHCEEMDIYAIAAGKYYETGHCNRQGWICNEIIQRAGLNEWDYTNHSVFSALVEAGLLTQEYTGLDPKEYGSVEYFQALINKVITRDPGFGDDLANGWYCVCEKLGPAALDIYNSIIVKDCGTPDFQAGPGKLFKGCLAGQWVNAMGMKRSTDISGNLYYPLSLDTSIIDNDEKRLEVLGNVSEKFLGDRNIAQQPDSIIYAPIGGKWILEQNVILDTTSMCSFAFPVMVSNYTEDFTGELFAAAFINDVTDSNVTEEELREVFAQRIIALERLIGYRSGHKKDELRACNFAENGGFWPQEVVEKGQQSFFKIMGWDETGLPTRETLTKLGLETEMDQAIAAGVPIK